jgi:hypothetical protein
MLFLVQNINKYNTINNNLHNKINNALQTLFYETCMELHRFFLGGFKLLIILQLILYIFAWEEDVYKQNGYEIYFRAHFIHWNSTTFLPILEYYINHICFKYLIL